MSSYQHSAFSGRQLKNKIRASFSKAAKNYDTLALFQKEVAEKLLNSFILPLATHHSPLTTIVDIGCGTGFLTYGLAEKFPYANIFGVDISHSMIKVARGKMGGRKWEAGSGRCHKKPYFFATDGSVLPYKNETFDIAASNLTYQWIGNLEGSFREAYRVLKPGSVFIFSTLGPRTLQELRQCYLDASTIAHKDGLPPFMAFSEKQVIQSVLESVGFKNISIETRKMMKTYPDMWALLKTMKSIGAGNPFTDGDKSLARGSILKKMAEVYEEKFGVWSLELGVSLPHPTSHIPHPNCIYATYEVVFVKAVKLG